MGATVEVQFKGIRREYFRWAKPEEPLRLRDPVIVEADRGLDFGRVSAVGAVAEQKCGSCSGCAVGGDQPPPPDAKLPPVVRLATQDDIRRANELRRSEDEIRRTIAEQARARQLAMRISDAEWQWDRKKLTVYFTAEQRVDFRSLVRDLSAKYHTRLDLRQIGVRDEAARIGGVGRCGREFCCSTWLKDLSPVSLGLAKDQHLSLNPTQVSGGCGRLLCCLRYEHEFYVAARKRFPKEGKNIATGRGTERVVAVDIFRERVLLRGVEGHRTVPLLDLRAEMEAAALSPAPAATAAAVPTPRAKPAEPRGPRPPRQAPAKERPPATSRPAAPSTSPAPAGEAATPARKRRRRRRRGGKPGQGGTPPTGGASD